jgi:hypothetical protein
LVSQTVTSSTGVVVYTVPAGHRVIVRSINLYNEAGSVNGVTVVRDAAATMCAANLAAAPAGLFNLQPWIVLDAGQTIKVFTAAGKTCSVIISGTLLFI